MHAAAACEEVHDGQFVAYLHVDDGPFPGEDAVDRLASERCNDLVVEAVEASGVGLDTLQLDWFVPGRDTWEDHGDRSVLCGVVGDAPLTASLLTP